MKWSCDETCVETCAREKKSNEIDECRGRNRDSGDCTHHGSIEKCIVEFWVCGQQLTAQKVCVPDVLEQCNLHGVGLVVWQREGPYRSHGAIPRSMWLSPKLALCKRRCQIKLRGFLGFGVSSTMMLRTEATSCRGAPRSPERRRSGQDLLELGCESASRSPFWEMAGVHFE